MKSPLPPNSPLPYILAAAGLAGSISVVTHFATYSLTFMLVFIFFVLLCLGNLVLTIIPWHGKSYKHLGVNRHLHLLLLPISIIWCVLVGLALTGFARVWLFSGASAVLTLITYINATLVSYALQDNDPLAPEFFQNTNTH